MRMTLTVTPGTPSGLSRDGTPLELWGVRVASAAMNDGWTESLVEQLDAYVRYGINALTIFYQGSSGGCAAAFSDDGREIDPGVRRRMECLVTAAAERGMVVVAGLFYQRARLGLGDAYRRAAEQAGKHLARFDNVLINVANEHNSGSWASCPFPMQTVEGIAELCRVVKQAAPNLLVGGGGIHPGMNAALALRPELDVLCFDWHGPSAEPVAAYRAAGSEKPLMNVELFGGQAQGFWEEEAVEQPGQHISWPGWGRSTPRVAPAGRRRVQGVVPPGRQEATHKGKLDFLDEVSFAAGTPGFSLFGHLPGWFQGPSRDPSFDNRFDLGGDGTRGSPGVRWYFEAVARAHGRWRGQGQR
jgi:hypothetical protein